ncbi:hypothetical protein ACFYZ2_00445 [Streptomyces sviceus]|uniref:hypothetical protein n=1 Tax=Streptomyces sviceus TaxID=285530 RepID=UPI0036ABA47C
MAAVLEAAEVARRPERLLDRLRRVHALAPATLTIVTSAVPEGAARGRAIATWRVWRVATHPQAEVIVLKVVLTTFASDLP